MNKKIKRIISIVMAITIFSVVEPLSPSNIGITKVYASSYQLTNLQMQDSSGNDISLYKNDNYTKELDSNDYIASTYYAKLSSDDKKVKFDTSGFSSGTIKIFKSGSNKAYNPGDDISVKTGKTTFYIRLYESYSEDRPTDCNNEYKVIVKRYSSEEEKAISDDTQGNIYLKTIELDYGDTPLGFDRQKTTYNVKVADDVKSIIVKAEPEDGATTIKINDATVDENDDYKRTVNLEKGINKVEITLSQDDEDKRTYIVNINRGNTSSTTDGSNNTATDNKSNEDGNDTNTTQTHNISEDKGNGSNKNENNNTYTKSPNKWVQDNGKWKYNDSYGNSIKDTWYYDSAYGKNYYFDQDGNMITGWLNLNNNWYYLNLDGSMATGWQHIGYYWYYLDYDGKMRTGWLKDSDGKYYYLYESSGSMAHDTIINGYKLGSNGVWIK